MCALTVTGNRCICPSEQECISGFCTLFNGVSTHGDGSVEHPGCDMDGDGLFDDSRLFAAKAAFGNVIAAFGEIEFALARYKQTEGGGACSTSDDCPKGPDGSTVFSCPDGTCQFCRTTCSLVTNYDECESSFKCSSCSPATTCNAFKLDQTCAGDTSLTSGTTVTCGSANPATDSTCIPYRGAYTSGIAFTCYNAGADVLVGFPSTSTDDNYAQIKSWINHRETGGSDKELRGTGKTPIGASLIDLKTFLTQGATSPLKVDTSTPCRSYSIIFLTDGEETCVGDPVAAATALRNMSILRNDGQTIAVDVKTYVVGLAVCPASNPSCPVKAQLDAIAAAGGTSTAIGVTNELELEAALANIVASSIKSELCNNADDNCNGLTDEDFPEKGQPCTVGTGACLRSGFYVCKGDFSGTVCDATAGTPGTSEICANNIDDDCDGLVDEGCAPCSPQTEVCNGKDDDCDGVKDEDIPSVKCGLSIGACIQGNTQCVNGQITCPDAKGPSDELCNGIDDDCDTIIDSFAVPCYTFATGCDVKAMSCVGTCQIGAKTCTASVFGPCEAQVGPASAEIACNGLDDNCDGFIDENKSAEVCDGVDNDCNNLVDEADPLLGLACGTGPFVGVCKAGTWACVGGKPSCQGEVTPKTEICDKLDNDCNGTPDDKIQGFGASCGSDVGDCVAGILICKDGLPLCDGEVRPKTEVCDGSDNDCDDAIDESDPLLGMTCGDLPDGTTITTEVGRCQFGVRVCRTGKLVCEGAIGGIDELCNGLDDNCDGQIDEAFPTLGSVCDNLMKGACLFLGETVCRQDQLGVECTAPKGSPTDEICNGIDDDCNGVVDDGTLPIVGNVCAPAVGNCAAVLWECKNGALFCGASPSGTEEICNGIDDDCDFQVDEPVLPGTDELCVAPGFEAFQDFGECEFGRTQCVVGGIECVGYLGPRAEEICNLKDDDCDKLVDDEAKCPLPTDVCFEGNCVAPCDDTEFPCLPGFYCKDLMIPDTGNPMKPDPYCVPDPCEGKVCAADEACEHETGLCYKLCDRTTCPAGRTCVAGDCVDCFDPRLPCPELFLCVLGPTGAGECVPDPCPPGHCAENEICVEGTCIHDCTGECGIGKRCDAATGLCVGDPCQDKTCPGVEVCDPLTGDCKASGCTAIVCPPGKACVPATGDCVDHPCARVKCPPDPPQHCEVDFNGQPHCVENDPPPKPVETTRLVASGGGGTACHIAVAPRTGGTPWILLLALALLLGRARLRFLVFLAIGVACSVDPFTLQTFAPDALGTGVSDGASGDGGGQNVGDGMLAPDARVLPDACVAKDEVCDQADNNCDGKIDETFDLTQDPAHCGDCKTRCTYKNAFGVCKNSKCQRGDCVSGYHDLNGPDDLCEYFCIATNDGIEVCDRLDNDCDGVKDDGFHLDVDVDNCGVCGFVCRLLHATAKCVDPDGDGLGACAVKDCEPGFVDVRPEVPGCELSCTVSNDGIEVCDGLDNDCNGKSDEGNPGGGAACPEGTDEGPCVRGKLACTGGRLVCTFAVGPRPETCNDIDDDCDTVIDDPIDKTSDPNHCGSCAACALDFASATCVLSKCEVATCQFGHLDKDKVPDNGCEYACVKTSETELCDGVDNNCEGTKDEGFDKLTDKANCGECGKTCTFPQAAAACAGGLCAMGACEANFHDVDTLASTGCEYACTKTGAEICNGLDDDCSGTIDDKAAGVGASCGSDVGECVAGKLQCLAGQLTCVGETKPVAESCDSKDNDCDDLFDETFDKNNDPRFCGGCTACALANAIAGCALAKCTIAACKTGFVDFDKVASNGCEYKCTVSGVEICDGLDNDCDTFTDEELTAPAGLCSTKGPCAGTSPTCAGLSGWVCNYASPLVEKDGTGALVLEESLCDLNDNDCDGLVDEVYPQKGAACSEDGLFGTTRKIGACRGSGTLTCEPVTKKSLVCNVSSPGAAAKNETCNNRDDDCDGKVDEAYDFGGFSGVRDTVSVIAAGGVLGTYAIYDYEASRPDATDKSAGFVETRACSTSGVLPWDYASFTEAQAACVASGMRLCKVTRTGCGASCCTGSVTADEWGRACEGTAGNTYPYTGAYAAATCNGSDYDPVPATTANEDISVTTGLLASCASDAPTHDQSGNLKEWVNDPRCTASGTVHTLRGGSFDNHETGLTCDFDFAVAQASYSFLNVGFRCCAKSCAVGEADCGGTCVDLASSTTHCGACNNACATGNCQNGTCCAVGATLCGGTCCSGVCSGGVCQ
jgi:hypothetical protein